MNTRKYFSAAIFLLALTPATHCMDRILTRYELANATVEQFESLQQVHDGICGACAVANAVAIDDILHGYGSWALSADHVQLQASLYPEITTDAYFYGRMSHPPDGGLTGIEILKYANSRALTNVFYMFRDLTIHNLDGLVDANELKAQIGSNNAIVVYFLCDVAIQNDLHTVLAVLIKERRHRTRILFMDSNNIPLHNYRVAQAQIEFISYFV